MLVQLSDPHIVAPGRLLLDRIDTPALLARSVAEVCAFRPAPTAVIVTGDLVDRGTLDEYRHLRELLAPLPCPVWLMPGNHDDAATLRAAFPDHPELHAEAGPGLEPFVLWAREAAGLRVVALDSVVPRAPHGRLCAARLAWLADTLAAAPHAPTVVAMHHPPFTTGIGHMDTMGVHEGSTELAAVLQQHPQVQRLICGHLHRTITCQFGGTLAMTAPSTAHQIVLDLRPGAPATYRREPPGFLVHALIDGRVVTHLASVGDHGPVEHYD